jgi:dihydropteroate synthase
MLAERANQMICEGADLLDVGGESTRPGAPMVSLEEELDRSVNLIRYVLHLQAAFVSS